MRKCLLPLAMLVVAMPAVAHDFWLQPQRFWLAAGASTPIALLVGHGVNRAPWGVAPERVISLRSHGPGGTVDHLASLRRLPVADIPTMRFETAGTHIVALASSHSESNLPAIRFNEYLNEEGLTPIVALRSRAGAANRPGREIYSRRAKTLVQVGRPGAVQPHVTRPIGLTLEIVPEINPYTPGRSERLPVRILYGGRFLPGALVKLTNLNADERPVATMRSDRNGRAVFNAPLSGLWQVNVVWSQPIQGNPRGDYDTTFSSLTFGYPAIARTR